MAVKIVNDNGLVLGTRVVNVDDDGVEIGEIMGVAGLSLEFRDINDVIRANLHLGFVRTEITANKVEWCVKNPWSGNFEPVSSVRFKSGAVLTFDDEGNPAYYAQGDSIRLDVIARERPHYVKAPREQAPTLQSNAKDH